jgi:hypothetical protein
MEEQWEETEVRTSIIYRSHKDPPGAGLCPSTSLHSYWMTSLCSPLDVAWTLSSPLLGNSDYFLLTYTWLVRYWAAPRSVPFLPHLCKWSLSFTLLQSRSFSVPTVSCQFVAGTQMHAGLPVPSQRPHTNPLQRGCYITRPRSIRWNV